MVQGNHFCRPYFGKNLRSPSVFDMAENGSTAKFAEIDETKGLTDDAENPLEKNSNFREPRDTGTRIVEPEATEGKEGGPNEQKESIVDEVRAGQGVRAMDNTPAPIEAPADAELLAELLRYLEEDSFTMDVTERQLRNRLEGHFGVSLKDRKTIIRDKVAEPSLLIHHMIDCLGCHNSFSQKLCAAAQEVWHGYLSFTILQSSAYSETPYQEHISTFSHMRNAPEQQLPSEQRDTRQT